MKSAGASNQSGWCAISVARSGAPNRHTDAGSAALPRRTRPSAATFAFAALSGASKTWTETKPTLA